MILVTGGNGMLGGYLLRELTQVKMPFRAPSRQDLDLNDKQNIQFFLSSHQFTHIIHLAAETDVDLCERDNSHAYRVNTLATQVLASYARTHDIPIIFISSSAVFGGIQKLSYCELDTPMPYNYYGASKLMAENYVINLCPQHLIIRSSFMIGGGPQRDKKFISKLLPQLQQNKPVSVVYDKIGSLTYAADLAQFIIKAITQQFIGLVHFSSENSCSRYDVIKHIAKKINSSSVVSKATTQMFPSSAPRANSESLYSLSPHIDCFKSWEIIIDDYLTEWL